MLLLLYDDTVDSVSIHLIAHVGRCEVQRTKTMACSLANVSASELITINDATGHRISDFGNFDECVQAGLTVSPWAGRICVDATTNLLPRGRLEPLTRDCFLIHSQYCTVGIVSYDGVIGMGACFPRGCTADVVQVDPGVRDWLALLNPLPFSLAVPGVPLQAGCGGYAPTSWDYPSVATAVVLIGVCVVVAIATAVRAAVDAGWLQHMRTTKQFESTDAPTKPQPDTWLQLVDCFALQSTVGALLAADRAGPLAALNGVRVLSMSLVILGHTLFFGLTPGYINMQFYPAALADPAWQVIPSAEFAVDTFFALSGFLAAYLLLKKAVPICNRLKANTASQQPASATSAPLLGGEEEEEEPAARPSLLRRLRTAAGESVILIALFLTHRMVRLLPTVAAFVYFSGYLLERTVPDGVFTYALGGNAQQCRNNGWSNLLFLNNQLPVSDNIFGNECNGWFWYLSTDTQLYLATPVFVLAYAAWRPGGIALLVSAITAAIIGNIMLVRDNDLTSFLVPNTADDASKEGDYNNLFYINTWARSPPYLIGVLLSCAAVDLLPAYTRKAKDVDVSDDADQQEEDLTPAWRRAAGAVWQPAAAAVSVGLLGLLWYWPSQAYANQSYANELPYTAIVAYTAVARTAWAASLCVLLWLCFIDSVWVRPINRLLSLPLWQPLAKLTFGAYCVHPILMMIYYYSSASLMRYSPLWLAMHYAGFAVFSYVAASLVFVTTELPPSLVEKLLLQHALGSHLRKPDSAGATPGVQAVDGSSNVSVSVSGGGGSGSYSAVAPRSRFAARPTPGDASSHSLN